MDDETALDEAEAEMFKHLHDLDTHLQYESEAEQELGGSFLSFLSFSLYFFSSINPQFVLGSWKLVLHFHHGGLHPILAHNSCDSRVNIFFWNTNLWQSSYILDEWWEEEDEDIYANQGGQDTFDTYRLVTS